MRFLQRGVILCLPKDAVGPVKRAPSAEFWASPVVFLVFEPFPQGPKVVRWLPQGGVQHALRSLGARAWALAEWLRSVEDSSEWFRRRST